MHDAILKKLDQRVNRRSFLRGSGLAATGLLGAAVFPVPSAAQAQGQPAGGNADGTSKDGPADQEPARDDKTRDPNRPTDEAFLVTRKDETGRDYRVCPQCGYNMYQQDRTWTCENCGFSYTE